MTYNEKNQTDWKNLDGKPIYFVVIGTFWEPFWHTLPLGIIEATLSCNGKSVLSNIPEIIQKTFNPDIRIANIWTNDIDQLYEYCFLTKKDAKKAFDKIKRKKDGELRRKRTYFEKKIKEYKETCMTYESYIELINKKLGE